MMVMAISSSQLYLVTSCDGPIAAWRALRNHFECDMLVNRLLLMEHYFHMEMQEGSSVEHHIKTMKKQLLFHNKKGYVKMTYVIVKAPQHVYMKNTAFGGVSRQIQHSALPRAVLASRHIPSCCIFHTHKHRRCFNCYIVFPGRLAWSDFLVQPNCSDLRSPRCQ